jgi:hypothetical protein
MGDIVNLNRARKAKARAGAKAAAAENRVKFGRTKGEKKGVEGERAAIARIVDGAKLDPE